MTANLSEEKIDNKYANIKAVIFFNKPQGLSVLV